MKCWTFLASICLLHVVTDGAMISKDDHFHADSREVELVGSEIEQELRDPRIFMHIVISRTTTTTSTSYSTVTTHTFCVLKFTGVKSCLGVLKRKRRNEEEAYSQLPETPRAIKEAPEVVTDRTKTQLITLPEGVARSGRIFASTTATTITSVVSDTTTVYTQTMAIMITSCNKKFVVNVPPCGIGKK